MQTDASLRKHQGIFFLKFLINCLWQLCLIWPRLLVIGNHSAAEATLIKAPTREWRGRGEQRRVICGLLGVVCAE